jgi:hypothetical protein
MKKLISLFLISSLAIGSASFAATDNTKPVTTPLATATPTNINESTKRVEPKVANSDFSKAFLHTAKNIQPYHFELAEKDFATSQWQKYVSDIYVQSTDINYYVSILFANGSLKQVILMTAEDVNALIDDAKVLNSNLQKEAHNKPEVKYTANFKAVYQASWQLIDEKDLISPQTISGLHLQDNYTELSGILINSCKIYKKGNLYILKTSVYPMGSWSSLTSEKLSDIDEALNKITTKNTKLLVDAKLIEAPSPKQEAITSAPKK